MRCPKRWSTVPTTPAPRCPSRPRRAARRGVGGGILAREDVRAPTVSCITVPGDAVRLAQLLRDRGYEVGAGYGALVASTIRIGHMGDHTVREVRALLAALDEALLEL